MHREYKLRRGLFSCSQDQPGQQGWTPEDGKSGSDQAAVEPYKDTGHQEEPPGRQEGGEEEGRGKGEETGGAEAKDADGAREGKPESGGRGGTNVESICPTPTRDLTKATQQPVRTELLAGIAEGNNPPLRPACAVRTASPHGVVRTV
jgi:hypothetical protein